MDDIRALYNLANVYSDIASSRRASPLQMHMFNDEMIDQRRAEGIAAQDADYEQTVQKVKQMRIDSALRNAYSGVQANQDALTYQNQVAQAKQKAAKDLIAIDPMAGIKMADDAAKTSNGVLATAAADAQTKALQYERAATVMGTVTDQSEWDTAQLELAKYGIPVPPRYKVYNEDTQKWIGNRIAFSDAFAQLQRVNYQANSVTLRKQEYELDKKKQEANEKLEAAKEKRLQNNIDNPSLKEQDYLVDDKYFSSNPVFDKLPSEKKLGVIQRINQTQAYLQKNGYPNPADAKEVAAKQVLSQLDSEGNYTPSDKAVAVSSKEEFDNLPSGSLFINPADGKTYRKK